MSILRFDLAMRRCLQKGMKYCVSGAMAASTLDPWIAFAVFQPTSMTLSFNGKLPKSDTKPDSGITTG